MAELCLVRIDIVKFWFWFLWSIDGVIATVALYFFFSLAAGGQGRGIQRSAVAGDPRRFGSCGRRQCLVALGRAARCCDRFAPAAGSARSTVRAVLPPHADSPPEFSLSWTIEVNRPYLPSNSSALS
jgi:hypothetical protein